MAPTKSHLTMFLAIALIAAMLQPSAATRAEPPSSTTTSPQQSSTWSSLLPFCFHWPPIFSPPTPPPPPSKPQPKECLTPLMKLMPCKDFVTNSTAPAPPLSGKCCDGYKSLLEDAPICLCQIAYGELEKLMSAPLESGRLLYDLLGICQVEPVGPNCNDPVPPMKPAPTPEAAP
ncbi:unnamed protein product [Alopecurus aequalis]